MENKPRIGNFLIYIVTIFAIIVGLTFALSKNNLKEEQKPNMESTASGALQNQSKSYKNPPEIKINTSKKYSAQMSTNKGLITIDLFANETPKTVNNFVYLAKDGFYDNTIFHRIIKDFMIQGGDPIGDGTGGPGYKFNDEKITRDYKRGIVAMANSGPNTNGSQFFIMHGDYPLPKNYVIFGSVISGLETVDKIAQTPVTDNGFGENSKPTEKIYVEKIEIKEE